MIKRQRCLSAKHGGRVRYIDHSGRKFKIKTYCRFYQTKPTKDGLLCSGFLYYPECPDHEVCWR